MDPAPASPTPSSPSSARSNRPAARRPRARDRGLPSTAKMLRRGMFRGCPLCGSHHLFRWGLKMVDRCPRCGLRFERIEGHFIGAVGINTIGCFALMFWILVVTLYIAYPEFPMVPLLAINIGAAIVLPVLLYGTSKTLWTAIDLAMRPLEAHEVDITQIRT